MDLTVPMALLDFIPVVLFLISLMIMQQCFYYKTDRWKMMILSAGGIMIVFAGFYKALWKLLYAAGICDFEKLNQMFFPVQAHGFLLLGIAMILILSKRPTDEGRKGDGKFLSVAAVPAVFSGTMIFVAFMVFGVFGFCIPLAIIAGRMKKKGAAALFVIASFMMLGMGYLSSKDFSVAYMNWAAQFVNIIGQFMLLMGLNVLYKAGMRDFDIWRKPGKEK